MQCSRGKWRAQSTPCKPEKSPRFRLMVEGEEECRQFFRFKQSLVQSRREWDDRIQQRLNVINTQADYTKIREQFQRIHAERLMSIHKCIKVFEKDAEHEGKKFLEQKELGWLRSELEVERIVQDQTWDLIKDKCLPQESTNKR